MGQILELRFYLLLSSVFLAGASVPALAESNAAPASDPGQVVGLYFDLIVAFAHATAWSGT